MSTYCAGIVLYNPDIERLKANIDAILPQVNHVFLVDNGSKNIGDVRALVEVIPNITLYENGENLGIATALNELVGFAKKNNYEWILTLDQDSISKPDLMSNFENLLSKVSSRKLGMLTCLPFDRNYGVEKKYDFSGDFRNVPRCITSGCFTNVSAVIDVGGFDESMFIDYVDFDICFKLTDKGYEIIQGGFQGIIHEMGDSFRKYFLGREIIVTNHSPLRRYYYGRNVMYCIRKHKINKLVYYSKLYGRLVVVLFYEKNKREKIREGLRGIKDGRRALISSERYIEKYL